MSDSSTDAPANAKAGLVGRRLAAEQQVLARPLRSLVRRPPVTCRASAAVRDALALMHEHHVGSIVAVENVCDEPLALSNVSTAPTVRPSSVLDADSVSWSPTAPHPAIARGTSNMA